MEIDLATAVSTLKTEILEALEKVARDKLVFEVTNIELEFAVNLRADAKAKAGFKAWVVSAEAEAGVGRDQLQRIKIAITPLQVIMPASTVASAFQPEVRTPVQTHSLKIGVHPTPLEG
ncbi:trypco2 family protein [Actinoplanes sp. NPDC051633]|uniref:trypco2 family protein n=1 Tax=Actinoplanes sp. NPDC051633 TaxID=3155670 RepID=UPI00341506E4